MKRKLKQSSRTLFEKDFFTFVPKTEWNVPYPLTIKNFYKADDPRFGGSETIIFDDVLDYEVDMYFGHLTLASGPLIIQEAGKNPTDLSKSKSPTFLPDWVESDGLRFLKCKAKGILLLEHHSLYSRIWESKALRNMGFLLVCGGGIPRIRTRRVLHRLSTEFRLPVYLLADNTTWTYFMFSLLKRGLMAPHLKSPFLAVKNVRFLGLKAGDASNFVDQNKLLKPWKKHWDLRIKALRKYDCFKKAAWQKEFDRFRERNGAVYLDGVVNAYGNENFITDWLLPIIENGDWLT